MARSLKTIRLGARGRDPLYLLRMGEVNSKSLQPGGGREGVENRIQHPFDVGSLPHKLS